jgi:hypothetical protein
MQTENDTRCSICGGKKLKIIGPTQGGFYNRCLDCGSETRKSSPDRTLQKDFEVSQKNCYSDMNLLQSPTLSVIQRLCFYIHLKKITSFHIQISIY